jgi:hypothetical protein
VLGQLYLDSLLLFAGVTGAPSTIFISLLLPLSPLFPLVLASRRPFATPVVSSSAALFISASRGASAAAW